jgi:hypothetical protein
MLDGYHERYGRRPMGVAADDTYGNGELLQWIDDRGITPYIRVKEGPNSPPDLYGIEKFTYVPEENCYLCPAGKPLNYVGINKRNRAHRYHSTVKRCRGCGQKPQCTRGKFRTIAIHTCEAARQKADEVAKTWSSPWRYASDGKWRLVLGTKEPDWIAALAPTQNQVRA